MTYTCENITFPLTLYAVDYQAHSVKLLIKCLNSSFTSLDTALDTLYNYGKTRVLQWYDVYVGWSEFELYVVWIALKYPTRTGNVMNRIFRYPFDFMQKYETLISCLFGKGGGWDSVGHFCGTLLCWLESYCSCCNTCHFRYQYR